VACYFSDFAQGRFLEQQTTNNYLGMGPHAAVEVGRSIPGIPGLAVTGMLDFGLFFGNVSQSFEQDFTFADGSRLGGTTRVNHFQTVENLGLDLGLVYSPPSMQNWARFGFGYHFEYWWNIGTSGGSNADFFTNGIYFRGELNF
jgi:hypothetical protein